MGTKSRWYSSSDYAGLEGGDHAFYYGYEQTNNAGDWLFVARHKGRVVMQYTAKDLGAERDASEVKRVLLAGIARYFELSAG
jgi:hypothetical protein